MGGMPLFEGHVELAELTRCCRQSCKGGAGPNLRMEGSGIMPSHGRLGRIQVSMEVGDCGLIAVCMFPARDRHGCHAGP